MSTVFATAAMVGRGTIGVVGGIGMAEGIDMAGGKPGIGAMAGVRKEGRINSTWNIPWNKSLKVMWRMLRGRITKRWSQGGGCKREMWEDISKVSKRRTAKEGVSYR